MQAIDIHFHVIPPGFLDAARTGRLDGVANIVAEADGKERLVLHVPEGVTAEAPPPVSAHLSDEAVLLAALDHRKLDGGAFSVPPQLYAYWATPEHGVQMARAVNDGFAAMAARQPARFFPLASLPLQEGEGAARELHRAVTELGLRGAAICTQVNGIDLDRAALAPVFAAAESLDIPLFIHPQNTGDISRLEDFHLWNLLGFPMETATAAARLLLSGVFETYPRLRVVLAHGGGFLPYQLGRLDHGHRVRPELNSRLPRPPTAYLGNLYCDSIVHDAAALRFLIERFGFDHVVLGTDYPFDMGTETPVDAVRELGLPAEQEEAILGGTLSALLKIG